MYRTLILQFALVLCLTPGSARSQAQLDGQVVDSEGNPIMNARVIHQASGRETRTDATGKFRLGSLPRGNVRITVRQLGFRQATDTVDLSGTVSLPIRIVLARTIQELDAIEVSEKYERHRLNLEGFYDRANRGIGSYITRDEIVERRPLSTVDLFRTVPGIRVLRVRGIEGIRFNSSSSLRRDCIPMLWIDGQRAPGMEVGDVPWHDIEGIELYKGPSTTPMQFSQGPSAIACGTVVVWSRPPPSSKR